MAKIQAIDFDSVDEKRLKKYQDENGITFDELVLEAIYGRNNSEIIQDLYMVDGSKDHKMDYIIIKIDDQVVGESIDEFILDHKGAEKLEIDFLQVKETVKPDSYLFDTLHSNIQPLFLNKDIDGYVQFNANIKSLYKDIRNIINKFSKIEIFINLFYASLISDNKFKDNHTLQGSCNDVNQSDNDNVKAKVFTSNELLKMIETDRFEYTFKKVANIITLGYDDGKESAIALVNIKDIKEMISNNGIINEKLFESNIRDYKNMTSVNKEIINTLENEKNTDFWWFNNGITIITQELKLNSMTKNLTLVNPQIVNGLQTSHSIFNYSEDSDDSRKVLVKILKINYDDEMALKIITSTNSQNEIRAKDLVANEEIHKKIENLFLMNPTKKRYYERKANYYSNKSKPRKDIISTQYMAKLVSTIALREPTQARRSPGKLMVGDQYKRIFSPEEEKQDLKKYLVCIEIDEKVNNLLKDLKKSEDKYQKIFNISIQNSYLQLLYVVCVLNTRNLNYNWFDLQVGNISEETIKCAYDILEGELRSDGGDPIKNLKSTEFFKKLNEKLTSVIN